MNFPQITFTKSGNEMLYYSSFVSTIDGKVMVKRDGYWPIGSENDLNRFIHLRSYADVIIDGKETAVQFGDKTIYRIHNKEFNEMRIIAGKTQKAKYIIITSSPDESLIPALTNIYNYKPTILTTENAQVGPKLAEITNIVRLSSPSNGQVSLHAVDTYLKEKEYKRIFIDGGAALLGGFLKEQLLDELFLTIAPKIVGNLPGETISLVEGVLFSPAEIKKCELLSVEKVGDEVFLRYKINKS